MGVEIATPRLSRGNDIRGLESFPRDIGTTDNCPLNTTDIYLSFVTAQAAVQVTKVVTSTGAAAAGATPTRCRIGVWEINAAGAGTLVASTANTTSLWAATYTKYETNLSSAYTLKAGARYALGCVIASGASMPSLYGMFPVSGAGLYAPVSSAYLAPAAGDLPASFVAGDLYAAPRQVYIALVP